MHWFPLQLRVVSWRERPGYFMRALSEHSIQPIICRPSGSFLTALSLTSTTASFYRTPAHFLTFSYTTMVLSRASSMRTALRRSTLRSSAPRVRSRFNQHVGRRAYASDHGSQKASSDLPW